MNIYTDYCLIFAHCMSCFLTVGKTVRWIFINVYLKKQLLFFLRNKCGRNVKTCNYHH